MLDIRDADVGGARVRRTFATFVPIFDDEGESLGTREHRYRGGDYLTADQVLSIPVPNRRALVDSNFLEVFPKTKPGPKPERFVVGIGKGKFNVIEGFIINTEPIGEKEAEALAHS